jgi:hypothetical protein
MPTTSHIDKDRDLTVFKVTGVLTFEKVLLVVKSFYGGIPTKHVIWDFNDTTNVQLSSQEVETISNFRLQYEGVEATGKTAFVAQKDIHFGLLRIFEIQSIYHETPYTIRIFRKIDEAYRWFDEE